eukprot:UN00625
MSDKCLCYIVKSQQILSIELCYVLLWWRMR